MKFPAYEMSSYDMFSYEMSSSELSQHRSPWSSLHISLGVLSMYVIEKLTFFFVFLKLSQITFLFYLSLPILPAI